MLVRLPDLREFLLIRQNPLCANRAGKSAERTECHVSLRAVFIGQDGQISYVYELKPTIQLS